MNEIRQSHPCARCGMPLSPLRDIIVRAKGKAYCVTCLDPFEMHILREENREARERQRQERLRRRYA